MGAVPGSLINNRYRLLEVIGQGSMGTVWHAHDETLDREVAVKQVLLPPELDDQERADLSALAMDEARSTARLSHPGIITIFDVIEHDGAPVIVMEFIRGRSLAEILRDQVRLPFRRVAEIGAAMLDALREAHAAGIVHRDLKPANVLITGQRVIITDFGIARRTGETTTAEPGEMSGTPAFVAPEQAQNAAASPAADLWSFGATLYNALEGHPPYQGKDYATVLLTLLTQEPEPPRSAGPLTPLIVSLLHKDPARRATAQDAAASLDQILHAGESLAGPIRPASPARPVPLSPPPASPTPPVPLSPPPVPRQVKATGSIQPERPAPVTATTSPPAASSGPRIQPSGRGVLGLLVLLPVVGALVYSCNAGNGSVSGTTQEYGSPSSTPAGLPGGTVSASPVAGSKDVGSLAFSPDGKILAVGELDARTASGGAVELLDRTTHRRLMTFTGMNNPETLVFSPDSRSLAVGDDDGKIGLWSIATHKLTATATFPISKGSSIDNVDALEFSHDGRTLFSGTDHGQYGIWKLGSTKQTIKSIGREDSRCVDFSPGGATVACNTVESEPGLWNVAGHRKLSDLPRVDDAAVAEPLFSPDGKTLAAAEETFTGNNPGTVDLWDSATGKRLGTLSLPSVQTTSITLAFSPDSRTLATTTADSTIILWDVAKQDQIATLNPGGSDSPSAFAFSGDGKLLAAGGLNKTIDLWDPTTHQLLARLPAG